MRELRCDASCVAVCCEDYLLSGNRAAGCNDGPGAVWAGVGGDGCYRRGGLEVYTLLQDEGEEMHHQFVGPNVCSSE